MIHNSLVAHSFPEAAAPPLRLVAGWRRWSALALLWLATIPASGCASEPTPAGTTGSVADLPQREQGDDWATFLGPRSDGTSAEQGIAPERWDPMPPLVWSISLGTSYGAPTIAGGRLLQFDRLDEAECVTCYNALTAEQLWHWEMQVDYQDAFGYASGPRCSPIVDGDRVYAYGVTGQLTCLDLNTGDQLWTKNMNELYGVVTNFFGVASNPCVHGDLLLVMVGGSPPESHRLPVTQLSKVRPNGSAIVALNKSSGEEVYRMGDDLASYSSLIVKEIEGRPTGLAFLRDGLLAWEPRSGEPIFQFPWRADMLESVNAAVPVVHEDQVFISEAYEVGSALLQVEQGLPQVVWQDGGPRPRCKFRAHWSTPVLLDGYLYGCSGRNEPDSDLRCVRFSDGEVQWFDRNHDRRRSSVLAVDGYLIVLGEYGLLELVEPDPRELKVLATVDLNQLSSERDGLPLLEYPCWAAPVLSHGLLYLRGRDRLVCLDLIPASTSKVAN